MNDTPAYNLGAVLHETGIKADTLRAWERRYNLPVPQRSEGGHRLYSHRDLEIIKWLLHQQENGLRIGQAVKLWRSKMKAGVDPLNKNTILNGDGTAELSQLDEFRIKWVEACLIYDETQAEQVANDAFTRFSPEVAFTQIFLPGINEIGELWFEGKITVQQEHFATALLVRRLNALITASPSPTRYEKIIVACPPSEEHTLSALLLTLFLRRRGFQVVYLGTNVPWNKFEETIVTIKPHLVLLTAQQLNTAATLEETIRTLSSSGVIIGYSGRIFNTTPELREYIQGEFLGADLSDISTTIEALLGQRPAEKKYTPNNPHEKILEAFEVGHIGIHTHVNEVLAQWNIPLNQIAELTASLSKAILAALYFGNLDLLIPELVWIKGILDNQQIEEVRFNDFLQVYANSTREVLGEIASSLVSWLEVQSLAYARN